MWQKKAGGGGGNQIGKIKVKGEKYYIRRVRSTFVRYYTSYLTISSNEREKNVDESEND